MSEWNIVLRVERAVWAVLENNTVAFFEDLSAFLYHCVERICLNEGLVLESGLRIECTKTSGYVSIVFYLPQLGRFPVGNRCRLKEELRRFIRDYLVQVVEIHVGEFSVVLYPRLNRAID